jgi:hypothetical protein
VIRAARRQERDPDAPVGEAQGRDAAGQTRPDDQHCVSIFSCLHPDSDEEGFSGILDQKFFEERLPRAHD